MTIIVEDGSGFSSANSFCSVSLADTYHASRGNAAWADLDVEVKEQALVKATDYLEILYSDRLKGRKKTSTQALSWPRYEVYRDGYYVESDIVPLEIQYACAEAALRADNLLVDIERQAIKTKVGSLEIRYSENMPTQPSFPAVSGKMLPYLNLSGGMSAKVIRT